MSTYFVTGATGFLGRHLVDRLLRRADCTRVYVLVRSRSAERLAELTAHLPRREAIVPVIGDLAQPGLGIDPGQVLDPLDHVVHLGAVYDFSATDQDHEDANVVGTRNVIAFAEQASARWLHHVSSIAVAGDHHGTFSEADFDLGQGLPSPYHATKFEAERLVREQTAVPWRVYRPGAVVGDSRTGEMDKVDGPYYFLSAIRRLGRLPARLPLAMPDLGVTNIVPVDYVVDAMDHLMHAEAESGSTYHLVSPRPQTLVEVYNRFAEALNAPRVVATVPVRWTAPLRRLGRASGRVARSTVDFLPGGKQAREAVLTEVGIPPQVIPHMSLPTTFASHATQVALRGTGIEPPAFGDYAARLVRYWAEHLDPDRFWRASRGRSLSGRRILITGASSGIGRASALAVAEQGATVLLVARRADQLTALRDEIVAAGGTAHVHPCDLTDGESVDALVKQILDQHESVDMLVNNAGRSIRRSVHLAVDRLHDFERTMTLNYFAPLRLILGLLPHMRERGFGHIVNVTTMGLQTDTPRFSAYLASKAALEAFSRSAGRETLGDGITFTSVRMPLVRTPMVAPTGIYRALPASSPEKAAKLVVKALTKRPEVVERPGGVASQLLRDVAPATARRAMYFGYRIMPESAPEAKEKPKPPLASIAATATRLLWRSL